MKVFSSNHRLLLLLGAALLSYGCTAFENQAHQEIRNLKPADLVSTSLTSQIFNRMLEIGDFALFNELFKDAELMLVDDVTLEEEGLASLNIRNLVCTDFNLGDLQTEYEVFEENGNEVLAFTVTVQPFSMRCSADYSYSLLSFLSTFGLPGISDDGRFSGVTTGNMVETRIDLVSPSFELEPPSIADVEFCNAVINIDGKIDFEDGALDEILEAFSDPIADLVQDEAAKGKHSSSKSSDCQLL